MSVHSTFWCALGVTCDLFSANGKYRFRDWVRPFTAATSSDANSCNFHTTDHIQRDGGDGCKISENEDLEVQMDLTDDLLHMVFAASMF